MDNLHILITGDNKNFLNALNGAKEGVRKTARDVEQSGMSIEQMFDRIQRAAALSLAGFSAKEFIQKVVQVRGEFQQLEVAFTTMLGSAEKANALMSQLTKTAASTPFDLQGVTQGAKQLLAYGIEAEKVNDTLIHLGDIAAGLSLPLNDLVYLYGTTMTQGRMFTQDLRQFQNRGIPIAEELAKVLGVTKDKVGELVTAGKVGAEEFNKAIMAMSSEGGKFAGLMENQSKTITGQISNIEDAIDSMFNNIGQQSEGIINGTLSVVSSLVENYDKVGKVILDLVAVYGVYKTAVMTATALQGLQAAGLGALTVAETVHYGWLVLVQKAQALLNATMLANPYVLAATAIAGLVAVSISLYDATTAQEQAEKSLEKTLDDVKNKQEEYNKETEEAIKLASDDSAATQDRESALNSLIAKYPEIIQKYIDEKGHLRDILKLKQEIAALDGKLQRDEISNTLKNEAEDAKKYASAIARYRSAGARGRDALKEDRELYNEAVTYYLEKTGKSRFGNVDPLKIQQYFQSLSQTATKKYARNLTENRITDFTSEGGALENYSDAQLKALQKRLRDSQAQDKKKTAVFISDLNDYLTYNDRESLLTRVNGMISARNQPRSTPSQRKAALKKELDDAKKALEDFDKSSAKYTANEAEAARAELQKTVDEAEKAYKAFGGTTSSRSSSSRTNSANREAERRIRDNEQADQLVIRMRQQTEDELTSVMEEGSDKRIKEIEDAYKREIAEIDRNESEIKKKRGGSLTESDSKAIADARDAADKKRQKDLLEEYREEAQAMRDYLKEYGSYEQQRLAITEEYEQKIREARTEGEKLRLQEEYKQAQSNLNLTNIMGGIDWRAVFGGVENMTTDMMKVLSEQLRAWQKSPEYESSDAETKQQVAQMLADMRQYIGSDMSVTWKTLADDIEKFNGAVETFKVAQEAEKPFVEAYENARKSEKEAISKLQEMLKKRENGDNDVTEQDIKEQRDVVNDLTAQTQSAAEAMKPYSEATAKAQKEVTNLGHQVNTTTDELKNFVPEWMASFNDNPVLNGIDGYGNVQSAFNGIKDLQNTISTFQAENGASSVLQGASDVMGSIGGAVSGALNQVFGSTIGIIAQIPKLILSLADAVKNFVTGILDAVAELLRFEWLSDLVDSILEAIVGVVDAIFDLPESLAKLISNVVVKGIGGLLDGVIGRVTSVFGIHGNPSDWFTNSNAKEVAETTERLTKANEGLADRISDLTDAMSNQSGLKAVETYEAALEAQKELQDNNLEILRSQMGYHNAHHSNEHYTSDWRIEQLYREAEGRLKAINKDFPEIHSLEDVYKAIESDPSYLKAIKDYAPDLWQYLTTVGKYDKSEYWDQVVEQAGVVDDLTQKINDNLTQTSFDSLRDSFKDTLLDMESSSEDFAKSFEDMMYKAMVNAFVLDSDFDDWLKDWQERYANAVKTNDTALLAQLRQESVNMRDQLVAERDQLAATMGYDGSDTYKQEASSRGFQAMSQDTGEELNGRFTALQIAGESINAQMMVAVTHLEQITALHVGTNTYLSEMRELAVSRNSYLEDIAKYSKQMYLDFSEKIDDLVTNTKNL